MMLAIEPHYVLPPSVPTVVVYLMAAAAIAAWVIAHRLKARIRALPMRALAFTSRVIIGFLAMLAVAQVCQRGLALATNWSIWPIALLGAAAVETVLGLYSVERQTVSRGIGLALAALRVALVALVVTMLAQPVRPWDLDKTIQRYVAVLVDTSASMYVPDTQLGVSERVRLAERFSPDGFRRPYALDATADEIDRVRGDLGAQSEWLASISAAKPDERRKQLAARRETISKALEASRKKVEELAAAVAKPFEGKVSLDQKTRDALEELRKRLAGPIRDRIAEAAGLTASDNAANLDREYDRLLQTVRGAAADLADTAAKTTAMSQTIDEAVYASLPPDAKARVDATAAEKRVALARDVLLSRPLLQPEKGPQGDAGPSLLDELQKKWVVRLYTFASAPTEVDPKQWVESYKGPENPAADAASLPPEQQQTDFAGAIEKIMSEMADKQLSGVLFLTDGRNNAPGNVEPLVRRLGAQQVPVSSVVFGSQHPPIDAGIISVEAPETIATRDRVLIIAQVKLDGLAGKEARVVLMDGDKVVDTQTVRIPTDAYRARVELADEPSAAGLHRYRVDVQKFDGEVLSANNQYPITVSVTDDRSRVLIVEGRPRWEFRYLKNLFANRDRTVRLQYVLFEPDKIEGVPVPPRVEASASRPVEDVEANALPKDEAEWMKVDVIILGDVAPKSLPEETQRILQRFVTERGGTLIVIAGPIYMPHVYATAPVAEMLPVVFKKEDQPIMTGPEKDYRIALTAEGRESVIMRQRMTPEENQEVWDSIPEIFWRHPILHAKEGATVLAYALPPSLPSFMPARAAPGAPPAEPVSDAVMRQRRDFERENALISYHSLAMGQVMFLSFDHTWRMRYRVGDTYHHRFWGQVLRWATANKLPAGTETVKLGTDRSRYAPQASVRVRARIAKKDFTPVVSEDVAVSVFSGDQVVLRRRMQYVENSPGMYSVDLGALAPGTYRVELDAPAAQPILIQDNVQKVATEFTVEPSMPAEQAELAPDRGLLGRLAGLTGGVVADPARADRVLASLGKPTEIEIEHHEYVIWDSWPMLVLIVLLATGEWLLRKKVGLA